MIIVFMVRLQKDRHEIHARLANPDVATAWANLIVYGNRNLDFHSKDLSNLSMPNRGCASCFKAVRQAA